MCTENERSLSRTPAGCFAVWPFALGNILPALECGDVSPLSSLAISAHQRTTKAATSHRTPNSRHRVAVHRTPSGVLCAGSTNGETL